MTHVIMKSGDRFSEMVMSLSQLFEFLLKSGQLKIPQSQDIEQHRKLCRLIDEFKPAEDLLEELEYEEKMTEDGDAWNELKAEISRIKERIAPFEKEIEKLFQQTE